MSTSSSRTTHARHLGAVLAGLVVVALTAGGCNVTVGNSDRKAERTAAEKVLGDGLRLDLAQPPSRADLALPDGKRTTVLQRADRKPFEVSVTFRDGHRLETSGVAVLVTAEDGDSAPTSIAVRRDKLGLDDLATTLDTAVSDLGSDRARADAVLAQSREATTGSADVIRTLPTGIAGPDRLEVESVVSADEGRVSVNYLISWSAP
jgi:hypothetical protein